MWRPRPKFKVSFYLYFCCFWINVTQINFENIKGTIQSIISDSCFQLKSWFNVDARAPSIPLLNFPFNVFVFVFLHCRVGLLSEKVESENGKSGRLSFVLFFEAINDALKCNTQIVSKSSCNTQRYIKNCFPKAPCILRINKKRL